MMNQADHYVQDVLHYIHAPFVERQRIEGDLRGHFEEALAAGEPFEKVAARMGAPSEVAAGYMAEIGLSYASFWRRLAAFVIDMILLVILVLPLSLLVVFVFNSLVPEHPQGIEYIVGAFAIFGTVASALVGVGIIVLYFPILEGRFGQTVGKRLLGLRVLKENGLPIGYREAFLRRISYYFEVIVVDALFIPFTPKRQRAFDIVARTVVIREEGGEKN